MPHITSDAMQRCIEKCQQCFAACTSTMTHCLAMGERHAAPKHIAVLLDCAELCNTSASFMLRSSVLHPRVCEVCAEACEACAESCEQIGDDEQMRACAASCRRCAESCREMATARRE